MTEANGHELARDLIARHGTDRYPTVSSQTMKVTGEWGELNEAILKDQTGSTSPRSTETWAWRSTS